MSNLSGPYTIEKHNRPFICSNEANYKHNVTKELTKKEYDKIMSLLAKGKSGQIHVCNANISCTDQFRQALEVCDNVLYFSLYTRLGTELITKVVSFPVTIGEKKTHEAKVLIDKHDGWRDKEIHTYDGTYTTYCQWANFTISVLLTYNEAKATTFKDNFGNRLKEGDEVYFTTGHYKELYKGKITKLNPKKATVKSDKGYPYIVSYAQLAKVNTK